MDDYFGDVGIGVSNYSLQSVGEFVGPLMSRFGSNWHRAMTCRLLRHVCAYFKVKVTTRFPLISWRWILLTPLVPGTLSTIFLTRFHMFSRLP